MLEIQSPFGIKGIPLKPELKGRLKVDETLIQTLAALMAFDGESRRLLTCALGGSLHTVTPAVTEILNLLSTQSFDNFTFEDISVTEVMIMAGVLNSGLIWVNVGVAAAANVGWRLEAGDIVRFSINSMKELYLQITSNGDRVQIMKAG